MKRKLIIDCDPGVDDAFGIVAAAASGAFDILGICVVAGNKELTSVRDNALGLVTMLGLDCNVYVGANKSLQEHPEGMDCDASAYHGSRGIGGVCLDVDPVHLAQESAVDFYTRITNKYPNEVEVIALGPLTNIAQAQAHDSNFGARIKHIYTMGGSMTRGNVTPHAEFNYWFDALAANQVLTTIAQMTNITMIGLHATHLVLTTHQKLAYYTKRFGALGGFLEAIAQDYILQYQLEDHLAGGVMHDLLVVLYALSSSVCKQVVVCGVEVVIDGAYRGMTQLQDHNPAIEIVEHLDSIRCDEIFESCLQHGLETGMGRITNIEKK
ncbi:MAG: nucleoside hydrolase [Erysipelotrichaceae bacterium]